MNALTKINANFPRQAEARNLVPISAVSPGVQRKAI